MEIQQGDFDHRQAYDGDNGIRYEPDVKEPVMASAVGRSSWQLPTLRKKMTTLRYDPSERRDWHGRWTKGFGVKPLSLKTPMSVYAPGEQGLTFDPPEGSKYEVVGPQKRGGAKDWYEVVVRHPDGWAQHVSWHKSPLVAQDKADTENAKIGQFTFKPRQEWEKWTPKDFSRPWVGAPPPPERRVVRKGADDSALGQRVRLKTVSQGDVEGILRRNTRPNADYPYVIDETERDGVTVSQYSRSPLLVAASQLKDVEVMETDGAYLSNLTDWGSTMYPQIRWELDAGYPPAMGRALTQFHKLANDYPGAAAGMDRFVVERDDRGSNIWASANRKGIFLNSSRWGSVDSFAYLSAEHESTARPGYNWKSGKPTLPWHPVGADKPESTITHEFGHVVERWLKEKGRVNWLGVNGPGESGWDIAPFGDVASDFRQFFEVKRKGISRYAQRNLTEQFAELFSSIYHTPKNKQKGAVKWTKKLLDTLADESNWRVSYDLPLWDEASPEQRAKAARKGLKFLAGTDMKNRRFTVTARLKAAEGSGVQVVKPEPKGEVIDLRPPKPQLDKNKSRTQRFIGAPGPPENATIGELDTWAKETYPFITWEILHGNPQATGKILAEFHKLSQDFPEVTKYMRSISVDAIPTRYPGEDTSGVYAQTNMSRGAMVFNIRYFGGGPKGFARHEAALKREAAKGRGGLKWYPEGADSYESLMTHEYGHMVDKVTGARVEFEQGRRWKEQIRYGLGLFAPVSQYAKSTNQERVAETFNAMYHTPKDKQGIAVHQLESELKKIYPTFKGVTT